MVNEGVAVILDYLTSGVAAVFISTLCIVIFGEMVPQAVCSRYGLAIGARTIIITYIFMILTSPVSFPISKVLDHCLGEEIINVYDKERIMELIRITKNKTELPQQAIEVISNALSMKQTSVKKIMTKLDQVYMVPLHYSLNHETKAEIEKHGYSRIPVYEGSRNRIVGLLHSKDLRLLGPDDDRPLRTLVNYFKHPVVVVNEEAKLDVVLEEFRKG